MKFGYISSVGGRSYFIFTKIFALILSRILLHGIVQNFAWNMLTLKDDIDVIFAVYLATGALWSKFSQNFWNNADLVF